MNNYQQLISIIENVHLELQSSAAKAVNQALTIRNWLIGHYIVEYEQNGKDRATYGQGLLNSLASSLSKIKGIDERSLRRFRQFYLTYPKIAEAIRGSLPPVLDDSVKRGSLPPILEDIQNVGSVTSESLPCVPINKILDKLSYTHIEQLIRLENPLERTFYEVECIKGTWSVRELKRQINSKLYERSGLSKKPEKLTELVHEKTRPQAAKDIIKNIYAFEFLDLNVNEVVEESDLEKALLNQLQQFILELGYGFCFEARQKRILIGETYYFIDLVFYHRILKCHVLLELKIGAFEHGDSSQLNTYLNFFEKEISEDIDKPPVGILLVAEKDNALVEYATAGMDKNLFVQQYLMQLPSTDKLKAYIEKELKELR